MLGFHFDKCFNINKAVCACGISISTVINKKYLHIKFTQSEVVNKRN